MLQSSLLTFLAEHPNSVLVEIAQAMGSTPREQGAWMLVSDETTWGTIGGGQLEFMAIDNARAMLGGGGSEAMDIPLGPEIGQCCGGRIRLLFKPVTGTVAAELAHRQEWETRTNPAVFMFGAGHVGLALAWALAPLPLSVTVVETRAYALEGLPHEVIGRVVAMPEALVPDIPAGGAAVILTHDHALDFLIAREALARADLPYVGMIGSRTKRATFAAWARREGMAPEMAERLVLPIGGSVVKDKRPEVIAAMVAAELLTVLSATRLRGHAAES
ncbi:xanthine dehydrogenase accessory protein XdhC [Pseudorhizobium endolithicum]|nr:xanthine dehydrogenase accessory protein XdhC [Pseudorhizobium endolithicum]